MRIVIMAWRNLWRNRVRSLTVTASVVLGLLAGVFSASLVKGMLDGRFDNFIEKEISHLQLHHPEYPGRQEVKHETGLNMESLASVLAIEGVQAATIRSKSQAMIASATFTGGVQVIGIEPHMEARTTALDDQIKEGSFLDGDDANAILIGTSLAEKMKVDIGSRIVLTFQDKDNEIISAAFRVKGMFETYYKKLDETLVYVPRLHLNSYLGLDDGFHEMAILADNQDRVAGIRAAMQAIWPELLIRSWNEISPELQVWIEAGGLFSYIFVFVILIGLAFGLLNTMLMAVFERTRELGMLMAIGMNKRKIFALILYETIFVGLIGTMIGLVGAYALISWFAVHGINLASLSDVMREIGFESSIFPVLDYGFLQILPVLVLGTAVLSAIYPAWRALQLKPADAVRK